MIRSILLCFAFTIFLYACNKGGNSGMQHPDHIVNITDTTAPVIQINKPVPDQIFTNGTTLTIDGNVKDEALYIGRIRITNENNMVLKEQTYEVHGQTLFAFNIAHVISVSSAADYTVSVEFQDHGLNKTTKTVKVKATP